MQNLTENSAECKHYTVNAQYSISIERSKMKLKGENMCSRHGFLYIRGWMQMVLAPKNLFSLCMLASWSHEGVVFLDFLPCPNFVTSSLFPCLGSTDAPCSHLGDPIPLSPRWRPYSQGPRTLTYQDPEQYARRPRGLSRSSPLRSDDSWDSQAERLDSVSNGHRYSKLSKAQGGPSGSSKLR